MTTKLRVAMVLVGCVIACVCLVVLVVNGSRTSTASPMEGTAIDIEAEPTLMSMTAPPATEPGSAAATETATFALG